MTDTAASDPPAPAWWRRYWRDGAATLVALAALALIAFGPAGVALGVHDYQQKRTAGTAAAAHLPGEEVRDGPVSFVVHVVHCGKSRNGSVYGQRCEITVAARNDGSDEVTIPGPAQRLHGSEGARHNPVAVEPEPFGTLRPGEAATATIAFDVPPHSRVTHVEVHADGYSRGQAVRLLGPPLPLPADD
ncbi:MAG: DUF4352 domain-containing protein [Micromonosporaceae bacterium]|nr:DUF4352 domain-containing protein [Micromonosporaceae bacterium]